MSLDRLGTPAGSGKRNRGGGVSQGRGATEEGEGMQRPGEHQHTTRWFTHHELVSDRVNLRLHFHLYRVCRETRFAL